MIPPLNSKEEPRPELPKPARGDHSSLEPPEVQRIARLTRDHPEVAVELMDAGGMVRFVIFDGALRPEYLPDAPPRTPAPVVRGSVFPKEPYIRHQHQDYEPIAYDVPLAQIPEVITTP